MSTRYSLEDLRYLMDRLRDPVDGCPWDLAQSYRSIAPSTIEEAYEVVDAIEQEDFPALKEELGDLLFQVVFYSRLASEEQRFDLNDVVHVLVAKLVRRHPHVFPDGTLTSRRSAHEDESTQQHIKETWEEIKQEERAAKGKHGFLDDVPLNLTALSRAQKLQKRASQVGFDWDHADEVIAKLHEEMAELQQAMQAEDTLRCEEELGDLLFTCVNLARHLKVDSEAALRRSQHKFERRFRYIENQLKEQHLTVSEVSRDRLEELWNAAKRNLEND